MTSRPVVIFACLLATTAATAGRVIAHKDDPVDIPTPAARARMIAEIKQEIQNEMGLLPVHLLRERRSSFVELHASDNYGETSYGTAGYLGRGYFVTVKHAVVALTGDERGTRTITSVTVVYKGKEIPARVIDTGDADVEVHSGDWAIIRTKELDLPALHVDTSFAYEFADPIFRLGNDYSKGIILSTGYVGQRTPNGLVTCLTDGHPGVSGGGVLDQRGDLVGIPIGRMQGDYPVLVHPADAVGDAAQSAGIRQHGTGQGTGSAAAVIQLSRTRFTRTAPHGVMDTVELRRRLPVISVSGTGGGIE